MKQLEDIRFQHEDKLDEKLDSFYKRLDYSEDIWEKMPVFTSKKKKAELESKKCNQNSLARISSNIPRATKGSYS